MSTGKNHTMPTIIDIARSRAYFLAKREEYLAEGDYPSAQNAELGVRMDEGEIRHRLRALTH